jgi:hypothetical protein
MNTPMASQPVNLPRAFRHGAPITQGDLNNMRTEFWTSRVDGNHQMWQTLRSACDALLEEDLGLANAILDAASLITPNGTLEIVYDERGHQYKLPPYVYSKPMEWTGNIPLDSSNNTTHTLPIDSCKSGTQSHQGGSGSNAMITAPAPGGVPLKLRIRINPGDYTINITLDSNCSIAHLKHYLADHGAAENAALQGITVPRQRIIYMGKQLPDTLVCTLSRRF